MVSGKFITALDAGRKLSTVQHLRTTVVQPHGVLLAGVGGPLPL